MTRAFRALLLEGLRKFAQGGPISEADVQDWMTRLHAAIERELPTDDEDRRQIARVLQAIYDRDVGGGLEKRIPGVTRYTIDSIAPYLRAELDRRIFAAADLIRLNKRAAVEKTKQRFAGWISSVPPAGTTDGDLRSVASDIGKSLAQLKFERRRVAIDQGHKLLSAIGHVVAKNAGAIAGIWHDRGEHDRGYDARPEHLKRSGKLFLVRDSWAVDEGLVRKAGAQFTDQIEQPAELPFCSCYYEYITTPHRLPREMLTGRGRAYVAGKDVSEYRADASLAQIKAGNYRKGHARFFGLDISIETPEGAFRSGVGASGEKWRVRSPADYGYIRRTTGADGEQIDCYLGPNRESPRVWVIRQGDPESRTFDEQKVMLGFAGRDIAVQTYERGFSDGLGRLRRLDVFELSVGDLRTQLAAGRTLLRPVHSA